MAIITINGTDYQVYETVDDITAFAQAQFGSSADTWLAADPTLQARAGVSSTRILNPLQWDGTPSATPQPLAWPRTGLSDANSAPLDPTVIPQQVLDANSLIAMSLVSGDPVQTDPNAQVTRILKAGSAMLEYFRNIDAPTLFPQPIMELIGLWLGGDPLAPEDFGTCGRTKFDQEYTYVRGF